MSDALFKLPVRRHLFGLFHLRYVRCLSRLCMLVSACVLLMMTAVNPSAANTNQSTPPVSAASNHLPPPSLLVAPNQTVGLIPIQGTIDRFTFTLLKQKIEQAVAEGCGVIVFEVDTYGGQLPWALEISRTIKGLSASGVTTVAWVNSKAISAGILISAACDLMVMAPGAQAGDCAPVTLLGNLAPTERAKVLSPLLAEFEDSVGPDQYALFQAMCVQGVKVYRLQHKQTGRIVFANEVDKQIMVDGLSTKQAEEQFGWESASNAATAQAGSQTDGVGGPSNRLALQEDRGQWSVLIQTTPTPAPGSAMGTAPTPTPATGSASGSATAAASGSGSTAAVSTHSAGTLGAHPLAHLPQRYPGGRVHDGSTLLTMAAHELEDLGVSEATFQNKQDLFQWLQASSTVEYPKTWVEPIAEFLLHPLVRSLLMLLVFVGGYIELSFPGTFVPGLIALVALGLLLIAPWLLGLANVWHVVLIAIGVILVAVEIVLTPTFGVLGLIGLGAVLVGLVAMAVPGLQPAGSGSGPTSAPAPSTQQAASQLTWTYTLFMVGSLAAAAVAIAVLAQYLPQLKLFSHLVLKENSPGSAQSSTSNAAETHGLMGGANASDHLSAGSLATPYAEQVGGMHLEVGMQAVALTDLHPAGQAICQGQVIDVASDGQYISKQAKLVIVDTTSNRILVRQA